MWLVLQAILPIVLSESPVLVSLGSHIQFMGRFGHAFLYVRTVPSRIYLRAAALGCGGLRVGLGAPASSETVLIAGLRPIVASDRGLVHRLEWIVVWHACIVQVFLLEPATREATSVRFPS